MKIGIYTGSFNPVHNGHIKIANYLIDNYLDKLIVIPTGNYWHKTNLVDLKHRINMFKIFESDKLIVDTKRNEYGYNYKILQDVSKEYPDAELYLVLGADNIVNFDKWMYKEELLKYNFIIINRDNIDIKYYLDKLGKKDKYIITKDLPILDISATKIREAIEYKKDDILKENIDERVLEYIKENNLYESKWYVC